MIGPVLTCFNSYIGRLESRLLAVENLLAAQASMSMRNSETPGTDAMRDPLSRRGSVDHPHRKRKREDSPSTTPSPVPDPNNGEMYVNVRQGHLEEDSPAPDTVLDGMGALNLGDEDDYGYFGASFSPQRVKRPVLMTIRAVVEHCIHRARHEGACDLGQRHRRFSEGPSKRRCSPRCAFAAAVVRSG